MKEPPGGRAAAETDQVTRFTAKAIAARHARFSAWVLIAVGAGCILLGGIFFAANHAGHNVVATVTHEGPCSNGTCTVHVTYSAGDSEVSAVMHGVPRGEVYGAPWPRLNITYFTGSETDPTTNDMPDAIWIVSLAVGLTCVGSGAWLRRRTGHQRKLTEAAAVTGMTPEHEAPYALHGNVPRGELSAAMQPEDDRLKPAWEQEEARPAAADLAAARLAGEREHPGNADGIRDVRFLSGGGYDTSQVDELLRRVAVELDAGRPVEPLIANATFRQGQGRDGYGIEAVDWFLEQLLHRDDSSHSARMGADPWHHLAVANHLTRSGPDAVAEGTVMPSRRARWEHEIQDRRYLARDCADVWRDFGQQPGTHLRWVRAGAVRRELRTAEGAGDSLAALRPPRHRQRWRANVHLEAGHQVITPANRRDRLPQ